MFFEARQASIKFLSLLIFSLSSSHKTMLNILYHPCYDLNAILPHMLTFWRLKVCPIKCWVGGAVEVVFCFPFLRNCLRVLNYILTFPKQKIKYTFTFGFITLKMEVQHENTH